MTTTTATAVTEPTGARTSGLGAGVVIGVVAVAAALITGALVALALRGAGVTSTVPQSLGAWLTGAGLWGGWRQDVTSDLPNGAGWTVWAAGAPLLITAAAGLPAAALFRRWRPGPAGVVTATLTAAALAAALVAVSITATATTNEAGSVDVREGLTWWWTVGVHPGTVTGTALLMIVIGVANTVALPWWEPARHIAWRLVVVPGVVLTLALVAGSAWLTSSLPAASALLLLFPLAGTLALFALAGVPVTFGLTRVAPEPYVLATWQAGPVVAVGGVIVILLIAVIVGWVLRRRGNRCPLWIGIVGTALLAGWIALLMNSEVVVPPAIGAESTVSVNPAAAAVVGAAMAAVTLAVRGRTTGPEASEQPET